MYAPDDATTTIDDAVYLRSQTDLACIVPALRTASLLAPPHSLLIVLLVHVVVLNVSATTAAVGSYYICELLIVFAVSLV